MLVFFIVYVMNLIIFLLSIGAKIYIKTWIYMFSVKKINATLVVMTT